MRDSTVLVYAGKGSSHSWTWAADLLESQWILECEFVDERRLPAAIGEGASVVIVSGGDGFEIASAMAPKGFRALEEHVRSGGAYVGVCAGAYLPLPSRVDPFDMFNLSTTRIRNILPGTDTSMTSSPRTGTRYGSCSVVHPVRGEVELTGEDGNVNAPIYGGPVFEEPERDAVELRYSAFTPRTSFQVDTRAAEDIVVGSPAVVSCHLDDGVMVLAGPHLEHPSFPDANMVFMRLSGLDRRRGSVRRAPGRSEPCDALDRSLADLKVSVLGMERESFLVGSKIWDGGRMLELVEAVETRKDSIPQDSALGIAGLLDRAREELLSLGPEKVAYTDSAPALLVEAARKAVNCRFRALRG